MTIATQFEATPGGLTLTNAILLYRSEAGEGCEIGRSVSGATFASIHDVEQEGGRPTIAAGVPLSRAHLRRWTEALGRTAAPDVLPDNVLVSHPEMLAWWVPAKVRTSYFALTRPPKGLRALARRIVLPLPYPAHVFVAARGGLSVYALEASARPTADTPLLHSPVLNVFVGGALCWGNIPKPRTIGVAAMGEYEAAVFDSWSTHPNHGQEATVTGRGGLVGLWDDLAARGATRFPVKRLKHVGSRGGAHAAEPPLTLGMAIKRSVRS